MKSAVLILFFSFLSLFVFGQAHKFHIGTEMSLSFSRLTAPSFGNTGSTGFLAGSNIFIEGSFDINKNMQFTSGIGYLNTREQGDYNFPLGANQFISETNLNHNYIAIPIGIRFHFGSFFIHPEIGPAFGVSHLATIDRYETITHENGTITFGSSNVERSGLPYKPTTMPVFLSFGNEFDLNGLKLTLGVKSYMSLNRLHAIPDHDTKRYFGFGILSGVRF